MSARQYLALLAIKDAQRIVFDWHARMHLGIGNERAPALANVELRMKLLEEEVREFREAVEAGDLVKAVDALCDTIWVALGAGVEFGTDLGEAFGEVTLSNDTKEPGLVDETGKLMKGPGYEPPDIESVLARQRGRK